MLRPDVRAGCVQSSMRQSHFPLRRRVGLDDGELRAVVGPGVLWWIAQKPMGVAAAAGTDAADEPPPLEVQGTKEEAAKALEEADVKEQEQAEAAAARAKEEAQAAARGVGMVDCRKRAGREPAEASEQLHSAPSDGVRAAAEGASGR